MSIAFVKNDTFVQANTSQTIKDIKILHTRFITGLREDYGLSDAEIIEIETLWYYCGSITIDPQTRDIIEKDTYKFQYDFPNQPLPEFETSCVCRQKLIVRNDWITDGNEILVIGHCCNNMFIRNSGKTCRLCKQIHRNRKDDHCNACRQMINEKVAKDKQIDKQIRDITCPKCKGIKKPQYPCCWNCRSKSH